MYLQFLCRTKKWMTLGWWYERLRELCLKNVPNQLTPNKIAVRQSSFLFTLDLHRNIDDDEWKKKVWWLKRFWLLQLPAIMLGNMIFCRLNVTQWVSHYHINQTSLQSLVPAAVCALAGTVHNKTDSVWGLFRYSTQIWFLSVKSSYYGSIFCDATKKNKNSILY